MTSRRDALLALPLLCGASSLRAQAPKASPTRRLGVLMLERDSDVPRPQRPFYIALREKGWILDDNLVVEPGYADFKLERMDGLAAELVRKRVDLILVSQDLGAVAAARATQTIPIVFQNIVYPVELGLVDSYARPGRNATGLALAPEPPGLRQIEAKRLAFLKEVVPSAKRLAWVGPGPGASPPTVAGGRLDRTSAMEADAAAQGFETRFFPWPVRQDVDAIFDAVVAWRAQAVTAGFGWAYVERKHVGELLLRHRLPGAFLFRENLDSGGLLSYGAEFGDPAYKARRFVEYVDQLLRGSPPAELPVEGPRQYQLVINMKTANALGLAIPQALLLRADEVIQ